MAEPRPAGHAAITVQTPGFPLARMQSICPPRQRPFILFSGFPRTQVQRWDYILSLSWEQISRLG